MSSFSLCRGLAKWSLPIMKLYGLRAPVYSICPHRFTTQTVAFGKQIVLCSSSWYSCVLFCFNCFLSCLLISSSGSCCHFACYVQTSYEHPVVVSFPYMQVSSSASCCHFACLAFDYSSHHCLTKHWKFGFFRWRKWSRFTDMQNNVWNYYSVLLESTVVYTG